MRRRRARSASRRAAHPRSEAPPQSARTGRRCSARASISHSPTRRRGRGPRPLISRSTPSTACTTACSSAKEPGEASVEREVLDEAPNLEQWLSHPRSRALGARPERTAPNGCTLSRGRCQRASAGNRPTCNPLARMDSADGTGSPAAVRRDQGASRGSSPASLGGRRHPAPTAGDSACTDVAAPGTPRRWARSRRPGPHT